MSTVNTVLGPVETADLGFTLSHEHLGMPLGSSAHFPNSSTDRESLSKQLRD